MVGAGPCGDNGAPETLATMNEKMRATLDSLPHKPGIYLYRDEQGTIIYVGKATSLAQRVRSYFQEGADLSPKNRALVMHIADIEFIVVGSAIEALILENEYIKRHQPKYNVRLRDDKNYPYIKVSLTEDFPRVYRVRSFRQDGNRYFGPYTNSGAVDATLDLLNKIFPFRTCRYDASGWAPPRQPTDVPWKQKLLARPCTQYYIHRCVAPCVARVSREEYDAIVRQVILFLEGKQEAVIADLRAQMEAAAEQLEFEHAAALRDRIEAVEQVLARQKIINTTSTTDQDVIALAGADDETCAQIFFFRDGKLAGRESFVLRGTRDAAPGEVMASFVQQYYEHAPSIPGEILVQEEPDDATELAAWLRGKRGGAVAIVKPQRGDKRKLVEMVAQNARESLEQERIRWLTDTQKTAKALEELQDALNLPALPRRIECYDISNIQGQANVGAMIVFEQGKPKPADYRRFRIKTVAGADDYASHQEMLRRRFKRVEHLDESALAEDVLEGETGGDAGPVDSFQAMPDLIVIDGGRGHLNADLAALDELGVRVPIVGVAKEDHGAIGEHEEIYLPHAPDPLVLPRGSQGLYLIQRIRDEAHRFAITYHRQVRSTKTFASVLDEIPGIGPKRKKALLRHFGSVRAIAAADIDDLAKLPGMTHEAAERVKEYIGAQATSGPAEAPDAQAEVGETP
jgi:excinuclease ABC subunit C